MGLLDLFGLGKKQQAHVPAEDMFAELERGELECDCGCECRWLVSRGTIRSQSVVHSFVAIPQKHDGERMAWLAIGEGPQPSRWVWLRSGLQGENFAAAIASPEQLPFASMVSPALRRDDVVSKAAFKQSIFQGHDALLAAHPDLRAHFFPEDEGRDYSFHMPDCVFAQHPSARSPRNQQNFAECGERLFVRALLPIPVSDGTELRTGIWIELSSTDFYALMAAWNAPEAYLATQVSGRIETEFLFKGEQLKGMHATLAPRTSDQCLFVQSVEKLKMQRLIDNGISVRDLPALIDDCKRALDARKAGRLVQ